MKAEIQEIYGGRLASKPKVHFCRDCAVPLTESNQYPSCRKRNQHACKGCWNKRFYLAVRTHKYGLSRAEFLALLRAQGWKCAICGETLREDGVCVDHCHAAGHVRGLLCRQCNSGIGMLKDSIPNLQRAIAYLSGDLHRKRGTHGLRKAGEAEEAQAPQGTEAVKP